MPVAGKKYDLVVVLHDPSQSTEPDMYMAEAVALPGCRAWGKTPDETLNTLAEVARAFIESYLEHGDPLPPTVVPTPMGSTSHLVVV